MIRAVDLRVLVAEKVRVATDVFAFKLVSEEGGALPPFTAGSHIDVHLPGGLIRQYSLVNSPTERRHYVVAVLREAKGRGGSLTMHDRVKVGDLLKISLPKNGFELSLTPAHKVLIAGGIGITPFLSMIEALHANGNSFELHYTAKERKRAAFMDFLLDSNHSDRLRTYLTAESGQRLNLEETLSKAPRGSEVYVCGPQRLIEATLAAARGSGWSDDRIKWEAFGALQVDPSANTEFAVRIASSGKVFQVPANKTISDVLYENQVPVSLSCTQGVCGTCLTKVIDGIPDHRDIYLTPTEQSSNDQILICCSRSHSPELVLDL